MIRSIVAQLEGNITKGGALALGFTAWIDASGALEDSALKIELSGPEAAAMAPGAQRTYEQFLD